MSIRHEIPPTLHLALPLVLAEIGWMVMGIVDTIMVGHLLSRCTQIADGVFDEDCPRFKCKNGNNGRWRARQSGA